jgi:hypothetical protein
MRGTWYGSLVVSLCLSLAGPVGAVPQKDKDQDSGPVGLVNKAIKAVGSEAKLKKLKSATMTMKGNVSENGKELTVTMEISVQDLDKYRVDAMASGMGMMESGLLIFNGDKGWLKVQNKIEKAPEEMLSVVKADFHALRLAQMLVPLKDKAYKLSSLGEVKVSGKPAVGLKVTRKGYADVDIYFDRKTHLPVKCKVLVAERKGQAEVPHEYLFSEVKKISGLKHFTKIVVNRDGKKLMELELSAVRPEDKLEANLFAKPE